jgi:hypothetical protein
MVSIEQIAKIAAEAKNIPTEQIAFEAQFAGYLPEGKRVEFIENLHFLLQVAYLRGQRDLLIEDIEKQRGRPFTQEQPTSEPQA